MDAIEITTTAQPGRSVIINDPDDEGHVRLGLQSHPGLASTGIWLDVQARGDLIAALAATLPASDRDTEARRAWHAKLGIPS